MISLLLATVLAAAGTGRVAIIAGNNDGGPGKAELRYAERDAQRVAEVLQALGGAEQVHLLLGEDATALDRALAEVEAGARAGHEPSMLLFFYSGHADEHSLLMGDSRFQFQQLRHRLENLPARVAIAFVDACQSGRLTRSKGGKVVPVVDVRFEDNPTYEGRVFVTSSAAGETSQEADGIEASFFTHYLIAALRGAAAVSGDRMVSLEEAYAYVYRNTLMRTSGTLTGAQHPTYDVDVTGRGELVLTRLSTDYSYLVLPKRTRGAYYVRKLPGGALVAEVVKNEGEILRLAVEPGRYEVARVTDERMVAQRLEIGRKTELTVDEDRMEERELAVAAAKGGATPHHQLAVGYSFRSGYLAGAELLHGARAVYDYDLGPAQLGVSVEVGRDNYLRTDRIAVLLHDVTVAGRIAARSSPWHRLRLAGALEAGIAWIWQDGELPAGQEQALSSAAFAYRGRAGIEAVFGRWVVGLWGSVGQNVFRDGSGVTAPVTAGFEASVGAAL